MQSNLGLLHLKMTIRAKPQPRISQVWLLLKVVPRTPEEAFLTSFQADDTIHAIWTSVFVLYYCKKEN